MTKKFDHSLLEAKREVISAAVRTVLGRSVTVKCSQGAVKPDAPAVAEDDEAGGGADDPGTTFVEEPDEGTPAAPAYQRTGGPAGRKTGSPGGTVVQKIAELFGGQIESGGGAAS
ncbi:MAG: hypothetical protein AAB368_14485 [bacterium]